MNSNSLYQHFEKSEYPFIDKIQGMVNQVNDYYTFCLTDFLNPREVEIVKIICRSYGVQLFITSDYFDMEYSRVIIAPNYYQLNFEDFKISLLELTNQIINLPILLSYAPGNQDSKAKTINISVYTCNTLNKTVMKNVIILPSYQSQIQSLDWR